MQAVLGAGEYGMLVTEHEGRGKRYVLKEFFPRELAFRDGLMVRPMPAKKAATRGGSNAITPRRARCRRCAIPRSPPCTASLKPMAAAMPA